MLDMYQKQQRFYIFLFHFSCVCAKTVLTLHHQKTKIDCLG